MIYKTEEDEKKHLEEIKSKISENIRSTENIALRNSRELLEQKQYLRENSEERAILHQTMWQTAGGGEVALKKVQQLKRLIQTPYFGRLDFKQRTEKRENSVYIGACALIDQSSNINLIYDWRAPISSMFYDFEKGNAYYISPSGTVEGEIVFKRQYRIKYGQMEFMIDTAAHIYDGLLQKELSISSDEKMRSIIATIQKDQNEIIRDEEAREMVIQGVAGSGKTSIALHRIAFLLYKNRESLSSDNILILSPNKVFSDFISNVLPELGEETIPEMSVSELINRVLNYNFPFQNLFDQVGKLIESNDVQFENRIAFKSSFEFVERLNDYIRNLNANYFQPEEIKVGKHTISLSVVADKYKSYHRLPLLKRMPEIAAAIKIYLQYTHRYEVNAEEMNEIKKAINRMSGTANLLQLYKLFFKWLDRPDFFKLSKRKELEFLDSFGLAYLKLSLEGINSNAKVKHLIIDEMQDYVPIQYAVIAKLFNCNKTLLGDINQSLNPNGKIDLTIMKKLFPSSKQMQLNKSYRSTFEIINFAQQIAYNNCLIPMERHGKVPKLYRQHNELSEIKRIKMLISEFISQKEYKSLGIICKTEAKATILLGELSDLKVPINLLTNASSRFEDGIMITSAQISKGLEFDSVIVPFVNDINYKTQIDRSMLYIAVTRAMHELNITFTGIPSALLNEKTRP